MTHRTAASLTLAAAITAGLLWSVSRAADPPAPVPTPTATLGSLEAGDEIYFFVVRKGQPVATGKMVYGGTFTPPIGPVPGPAPKPVEPPVPVPGPVPSPTVDPVPVPDLPSDRFGLAKFVADLAATVDLPLGDRAEHERAMASMFRAMVKDPHTTDAQTFIHNTSQYVKLAMADEYLRWQGALGKLNVRLTELAKAGQVKTLADCVEAWGAIAAGLEYRAAMDGRTGK